MSFTDPNPSSEHVSPLKAHTRATSTPFLVAATALFGGRTKRGIPKDKERVVVIGGSSGIGRAIGHVYASRGARICIVGRHEDTVENVKAECVELQKKTVKADDRDSSTVKGIVADFAEPQDMVRLRDLLMADWDGVDTVIVSAGVSALRPLLEVAGINDAGCNATVDDIRTTVDVSNAAIRGNYTGPLVSAITLIPLLEASSSSPSLLLISSLAALVPCPTRSLYCSTKAASLLLYQSLAIEHPQIHFTTVVPSTVEGNFRASAVDKGPVREASPDKHGLKADYVATKCVEAVDSQQRNIFMPYLECKLGHILYWLLPSVVENATRKKYNF